MKSLFVAIVLCYSSFSIAGLINVDYLIAGDNLAVYDDESGLTWLDLSVTGNMTITQGAGYDSNFRLATNSEVEALYLHAWPNITDHTTNTYLPRSDLLTGWTNLFGATGDYNSYGLYKDEDDTTRILGVSWYGSGYTIGPEDTVDVDNLSYQLAAGVFLVQASVPEPSTLAIFALGMIGLAPRRFKKQS
jgi:hypothetical protein